jgi:hypothetical protein
MTIQTCAQCVSTTCISKASGGSSKGSKGRSAGAIAGGVIGGVIFVAIATWLVWRFCIKARRQQSVDNAEGEDEAEDEWAEDGDMPEKSVHRSTMPAREDRASMHTVASAASSVLTRASNVIQIAYIPGVTNRSPPSTPGLLVPPVPPLPSYHGQDSGPVTSPNGTQQDRHFFMPDMRDSTYSGYSDSAFARESIAPSLLNRSSVATTIYRNNAIVNPVPAQTVIRGKAAVVSVKSSSQSSPEQSRTPTPPPAMPAIDWRALNAKQPAGSGSASSAASAGATAAAVAAATAAAASTSVKGAGVGAQRPASGRTRPSILSSSSSSLRSGRMGRSSNTATGGESARIIERGSSTLSRSSSLSKHSRARRAELASIASDDDDDDRDVDGNTTCLSEEDDEPGARARRSMVGGQQRASAHTVIDDTPVVGRSPFSDAQILLPSPAPQIRPASGSPTSPSADKTNSLSAAIEEAAQRAARPSVHGGLGGLGGVQFPAPPSGPPSSSSSNKSAAMSSASSNNNPSTTTASSGAVPNTHPQHPQHHHLRQSRRDSSPFSDSNAVKTP